VSHTIKGIRRNTHVSTDARMISTCQHGATKIFEIVQPPGPPAQRRYLPLKNIPSPSLDVLLKKITSTAYHYYETPDIPPNDQTYPTTNI
ncbi:1741_t:CDS:1, partial [Paraglomus brasilianum]